MKRAVMMLLASCQVMDVDEIVLLSSGAIGICEPNKLMLRAADPIILTPASDFDVKYLSNRVEVTSKTWRFVPSPSHCFTTSIESKTNWVRLENQWREIGIIVEETKASIVWKGKTNVFTLETNEVGTTGPRDMEKPVWTTWGNVTYDDLAIHPLILTNVLPIENGGLVQ